MKRLAALQALAKSYWKRLDVADDLEAEVISARLARIEALLRELRNREVDAANHDFRDTVGEPFADY
jgi:hypothetical protein